MTLLKDLILSAEPKPVEPVEVEDWPETSGKLFVRTLPASDATKFEKAQEGERFNVEFAALVLCDCAGRRVFADTPEDIEAIGKLSAYAVGTVVNAGLRHNGLTTEAQEELAKNSETTPDSTAT
jgi:hypothetical protein